jgi:erythromycin esterase-like protein
LIQDHGFRAVAVEADWPDAYRVDRFVRGLGDDRSATQCLGDFQRFPTWMWRNAEVRDFVDWLREYNREQPHPAHFFGLDLYSMYTSIDAIVGYLERVDPAAAREARERYACFDLFVRDGDAYARGTASGRLSCEQEVTLQLETLKQHAVTLHKRLGALPEDQFSAEQNALLVKNAEHYYRSMLGGRISTWNLRDQHMFETLSAIVSFLQRGGVANKAVIWAHNSHLGDARATDMARVGELNLGQLAREHFPGQTFSVGFTTYSGSVTAAANWDEQAARLVLQPALPDSYEARFHELNLRHFFLPLAEATGHIGRSRIERAIGVVYRPRSERISHYFEADLARQFDALVHIDTTSALEPLGASQPLVTSDPPATYPFADDAGV